MGGNAFTSEEEQASLTGSAENNIMYSKGVGSGSTKGTVPNLFIKLFPQNTVPADSEQGSVYNLHHNSTLQAPVPPSKKTSPSDARNEQKIRSSADSLALGSLDEPAGEQCVAWVQRARKHACFGHHAMV